MSYFSNWAIILIILCIVLAFTFSHFIGKIGAKRYIGYSNAFAITLFFGPVIGLIAVLLSREYKTYSNSNSQRDKVEKKSNYISPYERNTFSDFIDKRGDLVGVVAILVTIAIFFILMF
jgi:hypothetical protein